MLAELPTLDFRRPTDSGLDGDDPASAFALLALGRRKGLRGALLTVVGIEGGAPRPLGSHMAVIEDGTYCGYISGGCVEAAVAGEAIRVIATGRDAVLRFGLKSPFMDIRLPCGGGIDLHVHVTPDADVVDAALDLLTRRAAFALDLVPEAGTASLRAGISIGFDTITGWADGHFTRRYAPKTRLVLVGRGLEFQVMARLGRAASLDVVGFSPDDYSLSVAQSIGVPATRLTTLRSVPDLPLDPWTAVIFLFHDHDWETALLTRTLAGESFFVGALGSSTTHAIRCQRLRDAGVSEAAIARIHGPMGLFGPTRDSTSLALSVMGQIAKERMRLEQP